MKKFIFCSLIVLMSFSAAAQQAEYIPGQALVQLHPGADMDIFLRDLLAHQHSVTFSSKGQISTTLKVWKLEYLTSDLSDLEVLRLLNQHPYVVFSQFNHVISYRGEPGDIMFSDQWSMNNTGQNGGTIDADIDAPEAWEIATGGLTSTGDTIVVAVIDNGFDLQHEDFTGVYWKNHAEIPGNNIDDDNNGFVDDFNGWNFKNNSDSITGGYHGTPVAGVIGARGDNNIGISGVNWNVRILPVVASVDEASAVEAYDYILQLRKKYNATNGAEGAFIVATNSSWGIDFGQPANAPFWCAMYDSLGKYGVLNVGATINADQDVDVVGDLPTACPSDYLISVTNTTFLDEKNPTAGYGLTHIDLGAPGTAIISTSPNNTYFSGNSGTSFATPHVTGAIALAYATSCPDLMVTAKAAPDSFARAVKEFILQSTDPIPTLANITVTGGRLNLYKTLLMAENYGTCQLLSVDDNREADADQQGVLALYPNPAHDQVHIQYANMQPGNNSFVIINTLGQKVLQMDEQIGGKGLRTDVIDIAHLPAGIYFLYMDSGYRQSAMHKFLKN